jgi:hypothetical protein
MDFNLFQKTFTAHVQQLLRTIKKGELFLLDVDKEQIWQTYLQSFDPDQRQENNCNCCRRFIQKYGSLAIVNADYTLTNLWQFEYMGEFAPAIQAMQAYLAGKQIKATLAPTEQVLGQPQTGIWHHLNLNLPRTLQLTLKSQMGLELNERATGRRVYERALTEIKPEVVTKVLDLIASNNLYRGAQYQANLLEFQADQLRYQQLVPELRANFCWLNSNAAGTARIRSTAIGSLLIDLSEPGANEAQCLRSYKTKVDPANYQRVTASASNISANQLELAKQTLATLGLESAVYRQVATPTELPLANLTYVHRPTVNNQQQDIFAQLQADLPVTAKLLKNATAVSLEDLLEVELPRATTVKLLIQDRLRANCFSLVGPQTETTAALFKWDNPYSWSYADGMADSLIRERVTKAGGQVNGLIRVSLAWEGSTDLDLHIQEPKCHVHFANKVSSSTRATLDVDANGGKVTSKHPVENIIYPFSSQLSPGSYHIYVHNYSDRQVTNTFTVEVELGGQVYTYVHPQRIRSGENVTVGTFEFNQGQLTYTPDVKATASAAKVAGQPIWGLTKDCFHTVEAIFPSPNYWDGNKIGNEHVLFYLPGAVSEGEIRPFFNEQLNSSLVQQHKKVFEYLGANLQVTKAATEVSGVGFSVTSPNYFYAQLDSKIFKVICANYKEPV